MRLLKNRPGVQVIDCLAVQAAVHDQLALFRLTEDVRLLGWLLALRTLEATWMKVLDNPLNTAVMIEKLGNWKFHVPSLPLSHTLYR